MDALIGERLRARRIAIDMSQQEVGDRLGVSFQQIQKYEKGTNRISASKLHLLCMILNVPVGYFFRGLGHPEDGNLQLSRALAILGDPHALAVIDALEQIKAPEVKRKIVKLVEEISSSSTKSRSS